MADKKPPVQRKDDFDAHQFQMIGDAAFIVPKSARGGVRDMAPEKETEESAAGGPTKSASAGVRDTAEDESTYQSRMPTLAESRENRLYIQGDKPSAEMMDTIYREPENKATPASLKGRLAPDYRGGQLEEAAPVQRVLQLVDPPEDEDPRTRHIDALMGPAPERDPNAEDPRFVNKNGFKFINPGRVA